LALKLVFIPHPTLVPFVVGIVADRESIFPPGERNISAGGVSHRQGYVALRGCEEIEAPHLHPPSGRVASNASGEGKNLGLSHYRHRSRTSGPPLARARPSQREGEVLT